MAGPLPASGLVSQPTRKARARNGEARRTLLLMRDMDSGSKKEIIT